MKKIKISPVEKKSIRVLIAAIIVQLLIILFFILALNSSKPVNIQDTYECSITVEEIKEIRVSREYIICIYSDSVRYEFPNYGIFSSTSNSDLLDNIKEGDQLSIRYIKTYTLRGRLNSIVEAKSGATVYRTVEEHNGHKEELDVAITIIFSIIELVFGGIVFVYVWLNKK